MKYSSARLPAYGTKCILFSRLIQLHTFPKGEGLFKELSTKQTDYQRILEMARKQVISFITSSGGYVTAFPAAQQGRSLFGKTANHRAICFIWSDDNNGKLTLEVLEPTARDFCAGLL